MSFIQLKKIFVIFSISFFLSFLFLFCFNRSKICSLSFVCKPEISNPLDIKLIVLGNSTAVRGLKNSSLNTMNIPGFNLSTGASNLQFSRSTFNSNLAKFPNLKILLISLDNLHFFVNSLKRRNGDYRDYERRGISWTDIPELGFLEKFYYYCKYSFPIVSIFASSKRPSFFDKKEAPKKVDSHFTFKSSEGLRKIEMYNKVHFNNVNLLKNLRELELLVKEACEANIKIVFFRVPFSKEYYQGMPSYWNETQNKIVHSAQANIKSYCSQDFVYLDLNKSLHLGHEYYLDPNHLNVAGSLRMTQAIKPTIDRILANQ